MKYRTQSANVLNEADNFQRILDWQLFSSEQDFRLFESPRVDGEWKPGDQLYPHPYAIPYCGCGCEDDEPIEDGRIYRQHVRPMYQVFSDGNNYEAPDCGHCDVSWGRGSEDSECWVCGKEFPGLKPMLTMPQGVEWVIDPFTRQERVGEVTEVRSGVDGMFVTMRLDDEPFQRMAEAMNLQMSVYADAMRGFASHFTVFDEALSFHLNTWVRANPQPWGVEPFHPPTRTLSPFEVPEELVEGDSSAPYDPNGEWVSPPRSRGFREAMTEAMRIMVESVPDYPPTPRRPEINLESYNVGMFPRVTINQQITQQRRH